MRIDIYDELCKYRTPLDNTVWRFKEDEDKAFTGHIQFKNGQYLKYCKGDFEKTKEMANNMGKIKRVNDPRMNYNTSNIYVVINGKAYIPETINMRTGFREHTELEFSVSTDPRYAAMNTMLYIKDVIHNPPATIVFWGDGSKTVVKCQDGEEYDPEKGLTMAFFKRMHDNKGHYFEEIKKWNNKYMLSLFKDEVHTMMDDKVMKVVEAGMSKQLEIPLVEIHNDGDFSKVEDNAQLKESVSHELKSENENSIRWALFYVRADRGEDEGYIRHPVVYKHRSSATRAAKRLISKLPSGVDYEWFVDSVDHVEEW